MEETDAQKVTVSEDASGAPVVRHQLGEMRITIHPTLRSSASASSRATTFASSDYRYVVDDLKRLSVVAGVLLVVLVVLSLLIH